MSETPRPKERETLLQRLQTFYYAYKGQIMTYGVMIAVTIILATIVVPGIEAQNTIEFQQENAQKILAGRKTSTEEDYRLPTGPVDGVWYQCVDEDYFLCSHVTLIPLPNRTTIVNEYGQYKKPAGDFTIQYDAEKLPSRCWTDDRNTFTETSFYEFSDVTCLVVTDYQRHKNMDHDAVVAWQKTAAEKVPTDWKKLN